MDPREILPHRDPFLFLDTIEELTQERARGTYRFKQDEGFFAGHFPGAPIVPGVIQVEAMGQLLSAMGLHTAKILGMNAVAFAFVLISECQFHLALRPGDQITVEAERMFLRGGVLQARCRVKRDGELAAEATLRGAKVDNLFLSGGKTK